MNVGRKSQKQIALEDVLWDLVAEGGYEAALLSDSDGFSLAIVGAEDMSGILAAMVASLRDTAAEARRQLGLAHVNELTLVGDDRFRLVCRFFEAGGQSLSLTAIVPPDHAYRRSTNQAIRRIEEIWTA